MTFNETIDLAVRRIVEAAHPAKVILFGSRARGDEDKGSDLDLMVIENREPDTYDEMVRLRKAVGSVGVDILVYSQAEFERRSQVPGTVLYWARKEGSCMKPNVEEALARYQSAVRGKKAK